MSREQVALQPPPPGQDLSDFPMTSVEASETLSRAHRRQRGPWFFSSSGEGLANERVISRLHLPEDRQAANLCAETAANFGVTREIHTHVPYDIPQAWARALDDVADGILYQSRFTTAATVNALAIFDTAGPADWPADPAPTPLAILAGEAGMTVAETPHTVTIVSPSSN